MTSLQVVSHFELSSHALPKVEIRKILFPSSLCSWGQGLGPRFFLSDTYVVEFNSDLSNVGKQVWCGALVLLVKVAGGRAPGFQEPEWLQD